MSYANLLRPEDIADNYIHQLRETIDAYSPVLIVVGEAIQNAIDSICEAEQTKGNIFLEINFDTNQFTIRDNGVGFPPEISYLYLGGGDKKAKKLMGRIGVGIKVTMFSSKNFRIRSRLKNTDESWILNIADANEFEQNGKVDARFEKDQDYLEEHGTEVHYQLLDSSIKEFLDELLMTCLPDGINSDFGSTLEEYAINQYPSGFAALFATYMKRYTYIGNVQQRIKYKSTFPSDGIEIHVSMKCSDPKSRLGEELGSLYGDKETIKFAIDCSYLLIEDTLKWIPKGQKARGRRSHYGSRIFNNSLGRGGEKLERTDGFNVLVLKTDEEYEELVTNLSGKFPKNIDVYKRNLFPKMNAIVVTIGRIPMYDMFLPNGSRRIISCNGVPTDHSIKIDRGRRQQAVRCLDIVVDVDATLNYGKAHIKNRTLVGYVNQFINDAYVATLERGTDSWVGKMPSPLPENPEAYITRPDLGLENFTILKEPQCENDVIALFFELAGKGYFSDYRIYGLSQVDMYDGRAIIKRPYDDFSVFSPYDDSKLQIIEFKYLARSVLKNFDNGEKHPRDINLVIAWDEGNYASQDYDIYFIDSSQAAKSAPHKVYPEVTKYIYDSKFGTEVQVLLLKDFVQDIRNAQSSENE